MLLFLAGGQGTWKKEEKGTKKGEKEKKGTGKKEKRGTGDSNFQRDGGHVPWASAKLYGMLNDFRASGKPVLKHSEIVRFLARSA